MSILQALTPSETHQASYTLLLSYKLRLRRWGWNCLLLVAPTENQLIQ